MGAGVDEQTIDDLNKRDDTDPAWEDGDDPGRSVEDVVNDGEQGEFDGDEPEKDEPKIEGVKSNLTLGAGGEKPDSSSFKMQGGKVNVEGQFDKGTVIDLVVKVRVVEVDFVDKHDNDGYVVGTDRRHIAKPLSITRAVPAED